MRQHWHRAGCAGWERARARPRQSEGGDDGRVGAVRLVKPADGIGPHPQPRSGPPLRVGTSGWSYPNWRGLFYPPGLKPADWLAFYARQFATVELNASFYRLPTPAMMERWAAGDAARFLVRDQGLARDHPRAAAGGLRGAAPAVPRPDRAARRQAGPDPVPAAATLSGRPGPARPVPGPPAAGPPLRLRVPRPELVVRRRLRAVGGAGGAFVCFDLAGCAHRG